MVLRFADMLFTIWNEFITKYKDYVGTGSILVLFVVMLGITVFGLTKNNKPVKVLPLILAPFAVVGRGITVIISKVYDDFAGKTAKDRCIRVFAIVLCFLVIAVSGRRIFSRNYVVRNDNELHIDKGLVEAMDIILDAEDEDSCRVVTMPGKGCMFNAYSSRFEMLYEEPVLGDVSDYTEELREAYTELEKIYPDNRKIARAARKHDMRYIVIEDGAYWPEIPFTDLGYELLGTGDNWLVYVDAKEVTTP